MKLLIKIVSLFVSLLFAVSGMNESVIGYTEGEPIKATKKDYVFNDDKLLIGAYYADPNCLDLAEEAGIEFFIESSVSKAFLDDCLRHGIGVIAGGYNLPRDYGNLRDTVRDAWVNFDYSTYKDHPALWGDDLIDEPGAASFENISVALNVYNKKLPGKIGLVNLFPAYANNEQLNEESEMTVLQKTILWGIGCGDERVDRFKKYTSDYINTIDTDYICVDIYPMNERVDSKGDLIKTTEITWLRNLDVLAEACRDTGRKLWVITQAAGLTNSGEAGSGNPRWCDEISDISQQAYASLAFGAGAVIHAEFAAKGWWDADSHMIGSDGKPTETYDAVSTVNSYLKCFADIYGKYDYSSTFLINTPRAAGFNGGKLAVTKAKDAIDLISSKALLVGCFDSSSQGKAYVITNMEELEKNVTADFMWIVPSGKTAHVYKCGETLDFASGQIVKLSLAPGEGVFMTVD